VLAALATGCGDDTAPVRANEVVVAARSAPIHLDPRVATDQASSHVLQLVVSGLVTKNPNGDFVPDLAESWEILDDSTRYRFYLRPGVRFHDGRTLTARDVVWTFESILDGGITTSKRGALSQLEGVEAIDELTVDFKLSEPFGAMLGNLTPFMGIVPHGVGPEEFNRQPIGSGPFRLADRQPDRVVLERFEDYFGENAKLDRVIFRDIPDATVRALELQKGSVQLVINELQPDVVVDFREDERFRVVEDPGSHYAYIGVQTEDPILSDPRVRRAIVLALDREKLVATLWRGLGVVSETMLRPGHWARNNELGLIPHDPAAAAALLDEAGYPDPDGDGPQPRMKLTFKTSTDETYMLQAQVIQSMLSKVGIEIEIRSYEFATFYADIKQGNFQLFSLVWTGVVDPDMLSLTLHSENAPPAGANRGRYRNPRFDHLVEQGARHALQEERLPFYLEAQEILAEDLPYVSLYIKAIVAVMPEALEGYENYANGEFFGLSRVYWRDAAQSPL
jgi:peptide/nickel transport system substrate-binding protein